MSKQIKFNTAQSLHITKVIDEWYMEWKTRICLDPRQPHHLGIAKEELKERLTPIEEDTTTA